MGRWIAVAALVACGPIPDDITRQTGPDYGPPARPRRPVLTPCPAGWSERINEESVVLCDPWPEIGHAASLLPCPSGWREETSGSGVISCSPWPATGRAACTGSTAHFPGEPGCAAIGSSCDERPSLPGAVYVQAGAAGDGSRQAPFGTIREALTSSATIIAIGAGTYDELLVIDRPVAIRGLCPELTRLTSSEDITQVIILTADGASLSDVTVGGAERPGIRVQGAIDVSIEGVVVEDVLGFGIGIFGASQAAVRDVAIRSVRLQPPDLGHGISVASGSSAELIRVAVDAVPEIGVLSYGEQSSVRLTDSVVDAGRIGVLAGSGAHADVSRSAARGRTWGLGASHGATASVFDVVVTDSGDTKYSAVTVTSSGTLELERVLIDRSSNGGLAASMRGTLRVENAIIRDTRSNTEGTYGKGIEVSGGATAALRRTLVENNRYEGISVIGAETSLSLDEVTVRDTQGQELDGTLGIGLEVFDGSIEVTRSSFVRNHGEGVILVDTQRAVFSDLVVRDTKELVGPILAGFGLAIQNGTLELRRASFDNNTGVALWASSSTIVIAEDISVENTQPSSNGRFGRGVELNQGSSACLKRVAIGNSSGDGIWISAAEATLEDVGVRRTDGGPQRRFGRGISIGYGSIVDMERIEVEASHDIGIAVLGASQVTARDTRSTESISPECRAGECSGRVTGLGIAVADDSSLDLSKFVISHASLCGLLLASGAAADLSRGDISNCEIGVCLLTQGYDVGRLQDEVLYLANGVNLDAVMLAVPAVDVESVLDAAD